MSDLNGRPSSKRASPKISWASGTAYDLFASLFVIHHAESTGLRKAWAAGVRNRLSADHREILATLVPAFAVPVPWLSTLGEFPDAGAVLTALHEMEDVPALTRIVDAEIVNHPVMRRVTREGATAPADVSTLLNDADCPSFATGGESWVRALLDVFANAAESGRLMKLAIAEYYERFFREEEVRIEGHLRQALRDAQKLASTSSTLDLVDELTGGLRLEETTRLNELCLIPSFWSGPLTLFEMMSDQLWVILFSARPRTVSLIPGDSVPDSLLRSLQAVSDQTRLRILKLLKSAPRTQVEISRELRLRPPTITHHLKILRLANLVRLTETMEGVKRYDVRAARLAEVPDDLLSFVGLNDVPPT